MKRENDKLVADSREASAKELLPDQQAARAERQARAMSTNPDIAPLSSQAALYPNWVGAPVTKPQGGDQPRQEEADRNFALEEELDAKSVFDPLLGLVPNQANHWIPSPAPHRTPLRGQQDLRHRCTSVKLCPQFHPLTWPSLGCQPRCIVSVYLS